MYYWSSSTLGSCSTSRCGGEGAFLRGHRHRDSNRCPVSLRVGTGIVCTVASAHVRDRSCVSAARESCVRTTCVRRARVTGRRSRVGACARQVERHREPSETVARHSRCRWSRRSRAPNSRAHDHFTHHHHHLAPLHSPPSAPHRRSTARSFEHTHTHTPQQPCSIRTPSSPHRRLPLIVRSQRYTTAIRRGRRHCSHCCRRRRRHHRRPRSNSLHAHTHAHTGNRPFLHRSHLRFYRALRPFVTRVSLALFFFFAYHIGCFISLSPPNIVRPVFFFPVALFFLRPPSHRSSVNHSLVSHEILYTRNRPRLSPLNVVSIWLYILWYTSMDLVAFAIIFFHHKKHYVGYYIYCVVFHLTVNMLS